MAMKIPRVKSRKVNAFVKRTLRLQALNRKIEERTERFIRPLTQRRAVVQTDLLARRMRLTPGQLRAAENVLKQVADAKAAAS